MCTLKKEIYPYFLHWILVVAHGIFAASCGLSSCGTQTLELCHAGLVALQRMGS